MEEPELLPDELFVDELLLDELSLDGRLPEARIEFGMARAEHALRASTRAIAEQFAAVHATLAEARAFPEIFVSAALAGTRDGAEFAVRAAIADLAARLSLSEQTIRSQDHQAELLLMRTPRVWALFREGDIPAANARTIAELSQSLPATAWATFDERVIAGATTLAPARFKAQARAIRERIQPTEAIERHRAAAEARRFWIDRDLDGMSWLGAYQPAEQAERAFAHVDGIARQLASQPDETRTLEQLRADVAADLLGGVLGAHPIGSSGGVPAGLSVGVLVPVMTLLGASDEPGILDGYGPIDAETARRLAAHAPSFHRILTHPVSGAILELDRTTYRVPADLARMVGLRDRQCSAIGCGRPARDCDIDHTIAWHDGGETSFANLKLLCRNHHRLKHNSRWLSEQDAAGRTTWTTPTGFVRTADPPPF